MIHHFHPCLLPFPPSNQYTSECTHIVDLHRHSHVMMYILFVIPNRKNSFSVFHNLLNSYSLFTISLLLLFHTHSATQTHTHTHTHTLLPHNTPANAERLSLQAEEPAASYYNIFIGLVALIVFVIFYTYKT